VGIGDHRGEASDVGLSGVRPGLRGGGRIRARLAGPTRDEVLDALDVVPRAGHDGEQVAHRRHFFDLRMLANGTLPDGYTVKKRKLVKL